MARVYFDADTSPALHRFVEQRGHSVRTTRQESRLDAPEDRQLLVATSLNRFLITHNERDFVLLSRAWRSFARQWGLTPPDHAGIIIVPQQSRLPLRRSTA